MTNADITLSPNAAACHAATMAKLDDWYDPEVRLLWNPPGSFTGEIADCSVHLVQGSAWYAVGLLVRDGDGDRERAHGVLHALLDLQYDRPAAKWHGTFARFAEWDEPVAGTNDLEFVHYDPNWRQFVGTAILLVLRHAGQDLPDDLRGRLELALVRCVEGEDPSRVTATYSNIALLKAVLEVEGGRRLDRPEWVAAGLALADDVVARFDRLKAFDEFNSPTYYGIDLLGLAMWRTSGDDQLTASGRRLEAELWHQFWQWYSPELQNLCGPYTRAYGMDMHRYVAGIALWMWSQFGADQAPLPDLRSEVIPHAHDLALGPIAALLARSPGDDADILAGAETRRRRSEFPMSWSSSNGTHWLRRTAWQSPTLMVGGEQHEGRPHAWLQYHPVTGHWRETPDSVGSFRFVANAAIEGAIEYEGLDVVVHPHPFDGAVPFEVWFEGAALDLADVTTTEWRFSGLLVEVRTHARLVRLERDDASHLRAVYEPATDEERRTTTLRLRFTTPE